MIKIRLPEKNILHKEEFSVKILQITNRKGGVGKTTIACHAAWYFAEQMRVLFIELDDQRNASRTLRHHKIDVETPDLLEKEMKIPALSSSGISLIAANDDLKSMLIQPKPHIEMLRRNILAAARDYEMCIIDSAPRADALNIGPMLFATHVLAPIELSEYSLQGIESLLKSVVGAQQQFNPSLVFLGMLPNKYVANSTLQRDALRGLFEKVGSRFMFDAVLTLRQAYAYAATTMEPAWKDPKTAGREAGKEIRSVMEKIESRMFAM